MRLLVGLATIVLPIVASLGCLSSNFDGRGHTVSEERERERITAIIQALAAAANEADPAKAESVLWLDDPRFSEIEDFMPEPFGAETVRQIHDWIRKNGRPGNNVRFTDTRTYFLSPEVAYCTAMQELNFNDTPGRSRVTFILLKRGDEWRVIHGHYSTVPKIE